MTLRSAIASPRIRRAALFVAVWGVTAWLVFPLLLMKTAALEQASKYFTRSALGIILLVILFGKTVTDLFFPLDTSPKKSILHIVFLTVYALVMAGGIILVLFRILALYLRSGGAGIM
jgi:hypothetical protein